MNVGLCTSFEPDGNEIRPLSNWIDPAPFVLRDRELSPVFVYSMRSGTEEFHVLRFFAISPEVSL